MKSKGFTLVELLAVIVVLAIIALIATPRISHIIKDAKEQSNDRSRELYLVAVEQAIVKENFNYKFEPTTCTVKSDGNLLCVQEDKTVDIEINIKGSKPCGGGITLENGKIIEDTIDYVCETPEAVSFAVDSWDTIIANVRAGTTDKYKVGDTKEVTLTGEFAGTYTVRIANKSGCSNSSDFSKTACGFVVEFVDIITEHPMNSTDTTVGGWRDCEMRTYLNTDVYSSLPTDLKNGIIDTYVVSFRAKEGGGTCSSCYEWFETTDKIYLFDKLEVLYDTGLDSYRVSLHGGKAYTRHLDYYREKGVTMSRVDFKYVIEQYVPKNYNGELSRLYWSRSSSSDKDFCPKGCFDTPELFAPPSSEYGVAPAFRIG